MSARASSSTTPPAPRQPVRDPAVLEAAMDAATSVARAITAERVAQDAAQHLRRVTGADLVGVALIEGEDPDALTVAAQIGFPDASAARARLEPDWRAVLASGEAIGSANADGVQVSAPLLAGRVPLGAVSAVVEGAAPEEQVLAIRRTLMASAPHVAAALERAASVRRAEQRRRIEAIAEITAGLAHELRNPLFGISSAAQLLRFRVTEDPVVEKNVGRVLREVERLNTLVTALLEYGRPSPVRLEPGDPDGVWDEVLAAQRGRLESKALRVTRNRAPGGKWAIDRGQLAQVFTNLLDNAIDAAPEGTDLALSTSVLPSGAWRSRLVNGGAMSADARARAFDLFFSTKPDGTGIGLPLCQRILEEHGGTIALDSSAAAGTAAVVTLPARGTTEGPAGPGSQLSD